jgi:mono/diheme cytochrome c family protein
MKKVLKIFGGILAVLVIGVMCLLTYVSTVLPNVEPAPDLNIELTQERIERGEYLANTVYVCMDCHSDRDYSKFSLTIKEGTEGKGGNLFGTEAGFPGDYYAKNLTPYHLGSWSDGEVFRAITSGVNKDGDALFPIMPYTNYRHVDPEDIYDIIAYIRTLEPIEYDVPESSSDFPMNFIINTIPGEPEFTERPEPTDKIAYGKYLVTAASCSDCHTPMDKGAAIPGMDFAGGMEFPLPEGGIATSANITPDMNTGIGSWTEEAFIARFKQFQDSTNAINTSLVEPGNFNTEMPWRFYSNMSEEELSAIYAYLKTQAPVENQIAKFRKE